MIAVRSLTFGPIYESLLGDNPDNANHCAAVVLGIGGLLTLWRKEPPIVRVVDDIAHLPSGH